MADTQSSTSTTPSTSPAPWYADPSTYAFVLGVLVPVLNKKLGLNLDPVAIAGFLASVVTFIALHKWQSGKTQVASIQHEADVKTAQIAATPQTPSAAADALKKL